MKQSKYHIEKGMRWGRLTCTGLDYHRATIYDDQNNEIEDNFQFINFKCDCGKAYEVRAELWKGKRAARDCGCGLDLAIEPKITLSVQVAVPLAIEAKRIARATGNGFSQWMRDCIQDGVKKGIARGL